MSRIQELITKRVELHEQSKKILDRAESEKRDLTAEETQQWDAMDADIGKLGDQIERIERQSRREAWLGESAGRKTISKADPDTPSLNEGDAAISLDFGRHHRNIEFSGSSPEGQRSKKEYRQHFKDYAINGVNAGLQTSSDPKGGYLAPTTLSASLIKFLDDAVLMRQLGNVLPPLAQSVSLGVPTWDTDPNDADWTAEVPASDISEDDTARVGKREFMPHLLTKLIKISMKMLRSSVIDIESLITQRIGYKFAITEEKGFMTGDGSQRPLGIFTASADGISTSRDVTASSTTAFNADDLINVIHSVKEAYMNRGSWIFHRDAIKMLRKLKDGNGQYLWQPSMQAGNPNLLHNRPMYMSEYAPNTFTTGLYVGIFGDFKAGYWIVDSLQMEIQRLNELFSLKNQVGLLGRKETDGMPVLEEAFARLKLA